MITTELDLPACFKTQLESIIPNCEIKLSKIFPPIEAAYTYGTGRGNLLLRQYSPANPVFIDYGIFKITINCTELARFSLYQMPNCCGIMILSKLDVNYGYRRKGVGSILLNFIEYIGLTGDYTKVICTNINPIFDVLLAKKKWKLVDAFYNHNSEHTVKTWMKEVYRDE